jgi:hypothetical protein
VEGSAVQSVGTSWYSDLLSPVKLTVQPVLIFRAATRFAVSGPWILESVSVKA